MIHGALRWKTGPGHSWHKTALCGRWLGVSSTGAQSFDKAPVPYLLSALAAVVYVVATVALALGDRARLALATIGFELFGVLAVGVWSYADTARFHDKTVWSHFGSGYGFLPLVLPFVGLWWIHRVRRA